jgi:hypothetical protein
MEYLADRAAGEAFEEKRRVASSYGKAGRFVVMRRAPAHTAAVRPMTSELANKSRAHCIQICVHEDSPGSLLLETASFISPILDEASDP